MSRSDTATGKNRVAVLELTQTEAVSEKVEAEVSGNTSLRNIHVFSKRNVKNNRVSRRHQDLSTAYTLGCFDPACDRGIPISSLNNSQRCKTDALERKKVE